MDVSTINDGGELGPSLALFFADSNAAWNAAYWFGSNPSVTYKGESLSLCTHLMLDTTKAIESPTALVTGSHCKPWFA
jgi:hypothetical protein